MNDSNRNNNEVEYCSRIIYCFKTKHKFKKDSRFSQEMEGEGVQSQDTTSDPHHNYILRIYLKYYSIITPTF